MDKAWLGPSYVGPCRAVNGFGQTVIGQDRRQCQNQLNEAFVTIPI